MKLRELNLDTFMSAIVRVNRLMNEEETCSEMLDAATKDTPVIGELMAEMNNLYQCEDGPEKQMGIMTAQRDLTILLALREIEGAGT